MDYNNPNYKNAGHKICNFCNVYYFSYNSKRKFCSAKCANISNRKDPLLSFREKYKLNKLHRTKKIYWCTMCAIVGVKRKAKYCKRCRLTKGKVEVKCKACLQTFWSNRCRLRSFCSEICKLTSYKGRGNPNYIDGRTPENHRIRNSERYKQWRTAVFKRDKYTCVWCGQKGGELNADHIKPFAYYPALRFNLSNGRTLCLPCHKKTDTYLSKCKIKPNKPTELQEQYLNEVRKRGGIAMVAYSLDDVIKAGL